MNSLAKQPVMDIFGRSYVQELAIRDYIGGINLKI